MRILHTSDWHLGRTFGPVSLLDDQRAFVTWMLDEVERRRVDLVVIAGDVFDRPVAPNEALVLFREALRSLQDLGVRAAVITGNHDGPDRVANYHDLLDASGVYLRGGYTQIGEVISLDFHDGPLDLVPLPFLDPQLAPDHHGGAPDSELVASDPAAASDGPRAAAHDAAHERLMRRTHESVLADAIAAAAPRLTSGRRSLAVSHAYVSGATTSDSERKLTVGGHGDVPVGLFASFSYTALGHLHRPQNVGDSNTIRYSGTPLAYSFSERHPKSVTIVDMTPTGVCTIEEVTVPVGRAVHDAVGQIDDLLRSEPPEHIRNAFVRVVLTDRGVVLDAKKRLSAVFPNVVEIILRPDGKDVSELMGDSFDTTRMTTMEATETFWRESDGSDPSSVELALLRAAVASAEQVAQ